jgi:SsrA-binding protein
MPRREAPGTVASNRRARHDYQILDTVEAGIVLKGSEVKTLREGKASLQDAYAEVQGGDVVLHMSIPAYSHTGYEGHEPTRPRKLLLHRREIDQLARRVAERGLTLVPLRIYFKSQLVKVELGVARGKRAYDKRQAMARRDAQREMDRARKARGRGNGQ